MSRFYVAGLGLAICLVCSGCHVCSPQCTLKTGWHWSPFWRGAPCETVSPHTCGGTCSNRPSVGSPDPLIYD